jgi:hypothetical protein
MERSRLAERPGDVSAGAAKNGEINRLLTLLIYTNT